MWSRRAWIAAAVVALLMAGGAMLTLGQRALRVSPQVPAAQSKAAVGKPSAAAVPRTEAAAAPSSPTQATQSQGAQGPALRSATLGPGALQAFQELQRLGQMPAGDAAIALGQSLQAGINADNSLGYAQALLQADHPAVERAAIAALARHADGELLLALAGEYGSLQPERRGRILQVLEMASNPDALPGLVAIVAADVSEKRSPVVMSALYGAANLGTMDSVEYLFSQLRPGAADLALMALERVSSPQGLEMLRAAASGNKDGERIPAAYRDALRRLAAQAAGKG